MMTVKHLLGHYVTYRRSWIKRGDEKLERSLWYVTSDQFTKYVDSQVVFNSEAYILCYEKLD